MKDTELINIVKRYRKGITPMEDAIAYQKKLSSRVVQKNSFKSIGTIAGVDLAIFKKEKKLVCGIVVFSYPELEVLERVYNISDEKFPYIPTLLAFREGPAILETYEKIKKKPDLIMLDGQGMAHPRSFGIACYIGVILGIPSFGVAKKRLFGEYDDPDTFKGANTPLTSERDRKIVGTVLRTKDNVKPVFISVGNNIDLNTSVEIALECSRGYRIPEPTRLADKYVGELKKMVVL